MNTSTYAFAEHHSTVLVANLSFAQRGKKTRTIIVRHLIARSKLVHITAILATPVIVWLPRNKIGVAFCCKHVVDPVPFPFHQCVTKADPNAVTRLLRKEIFRNISVRAGLV